MTVTDPAELSDRLRALVRDFARRLRQESEDAGDLNWTQQFVLRRLVDTPGMTSAELARADGVRPQSMNSTVAALREAGSVTTSRGATDGRRVELFVTDAGRQMAEAMVGKRDQWLRRRLAEDLTPEQRQQLEDGLDILDTLLAADPSA